VIIRAWSGWTTPENAAAYDELLNGTIAPDIVDRRIPGLRELAVARRLPAEETGAAHFLTLMAFDDWAAVGEFAGADPAGSVVPPPARALLARHDAHSQHFELRRRHRP
jgi:hypothetical protein